MAAPTGASRRSSGAGKRSSILSGGGSKRRTPRRASTRHDYSEPPVMVRSDTVPRSSQVKRKRAPKIRRRYDVALGGSGAEIRLPSLPQIRPGWRLVSLLILIGFGGLLYYFWNSPDYRIQVTEINGLQRVPAGEVEALLDVSEQPVFILNTAEIEQKVQAAFPEFTQVAVEIGFPDQLKVTVAEREPVLVWRQGDQDLLVDAEGYAFPARLEGEASAYPMVQASGPPPGYQPEPKEPTVEDLAAADPLKLVEESEQGPSFTPGQFLTPEMVSGVLEMTRQAPPNTAVAYDPQRGLGWKDGRGWNAYFGNLTDLEAKLNVYQAVVQRLSQEEVQPSLISVEYVHAPYYRLEQ